MKNVKNGPNWRETRHLRRRNRRPTCWKRLPADFPNSVHWLHRKKYYASIPVVIRRICLLPAFAAGSLRLPPLSHSEFRTPHLNGVQALLAFAPGASPEGPFFTRNNPAFLCVSTSCIFTMGAGSACSQFIIFRLSVTTKTIRSSSSPTPSPTPVSSANHRRLSNSNQKKSFPWCLCDLVACPVCFPICEICAICGSSSPYQKGAASHF